MCGIAGFFGKNFSEAKLNAMTDSMSHRGPDAAGYWLQTAGEKQIGLGHRRLSILDLSAAANQPMHSRCGDYVMVFNGEVYNYRQLAATKLRGVPLLTTGDSEVVLQCFIQYGVQCFAWFNGMFALAIWDKRTEQLTLARDHVGIKPLYIFQDENAICFASELKALKSLQPSLQVNRSFVPYYLHLGYIPQHTCVYENCFRFPAGSYGVVGADGKLSISAFWKVNEQITETTLNDETQAKQQLHDLLLDAVQLQLVSDVPIGTFLSGGIDSSVVTALAAKVSEKKVNTFSIAVTDGKVNEAPFAAAVAKHLGTHHHELPITQRDILDMIPQLMHVYDEPFGDSSAFPTMLVSKLARKQVTVALSGDGGDELFMGYGFYTWARRLQNPLLQLLRKPISLIAMAGSNHHRHAAKMLSYTTYEHVRSHIFSQYFFSEIELQQLLRSEKNFNFASLNSIGQTKRKLSAAEAHSVWDIQNYLKDDLLVKVDRASMRYSLESRVPLLDYRLVEFGINLAESYRYRGNSMKYLLKQVLYNYVPASFFDRPKWGFGVPLEKWLLTDLHFLIEKYLNKAVIEKQQLVRYDLTQSILQQLRMGNQFIGQQIWLLLTLHWWLEENEN